MDQSQSLFVKMALLAWDGQNARATKLFDGLSDEQLMSEVAPGRNRGIYLLGHLIAVNDDLLVILGLGERMFPTYEDIFLEKADKSGAEMPDIKTLRGNWSQSLQTLKDHFSKTSSQDWFLKHASVSAEDFAKEPHRNKLNVVISRTSHLSYHLGQLTFLQKK